jgi:hypothetical protein
MTPESLQRLRAAFQAAAEAAQDVMGAWDDKLAPTVVDLLLWDMQITGELEPW